MQVNLNDIFNEIYRNIKYQTGKEITMDAFLHAQSYLARELNTKFNRSMSINTLYTGDSTHFYLKPIVSKIDINNLETTASITVSDATLSAVLTKLDSADDNSVATFYMSPSVYRVERLYFREDGSTTFYDLCSIDQLNKSFTSDKGLSGYENIDGSGSVLDKIWSTIYFRECGQFPESRIKQYKDPGDMSFGGNFAFENSKIIMPKEILSKYIDATTVPNFELSGYMMRGIDVYSASTAYLAAGYEIFIPDYLVDLFSKSIEVMMRQSVGVVFDDVKQSVYELTEYARRNEADQINLVDRRKDSVF